MMLALAFVVVFVTWHVQAAVIPTATGRGGSKPEDEEFPAAVDDAERELTHLLTPEEDSYDSDHISYFDNTPENAEAGVDELASEEDRYLNGINKLLADTEDSEGEITPDGKTWSSEDIERAETLPQQESLDDLEPSSPSDDITNEEGDDMNDIHVEARASLKVPGFPDIKVVELNETLYLNSTLNNDVPLFEPVRMPEKFEDYDLNRDGYISMPELRDVTGASEGIGDAFNAADLNGN